jgi:hypothetical protein
MSGLRRVVQRLAARSPLICIGHSHTENVVAAAEAAGIALECFNFWRHPHGVILGEGKVELAVEIRSRMVAPVFSLVGGAVHHDIGLLVHPRPFDFTWPEQPDLPFSEGAEIVPYDAVLAIMRARTLRYLQIMAAIRAATQGPVFHMQSPPIYAEEAVPANDPGWVAFFGHDRLIAPAWHRYKLWRVHSEIVRSYCAEIGIVFVPNPLESIDSRGFMEAKFHGTPAHANQAYGALVLRQMQSLASGDSVVRKIGRAVFGR